MASLIRRDLCRSVLFAQDALIWSRVEVFGSWQVRGRAFSGKQEDGLQGEGSWDRIDRSGRVSDDGSGVESRRGEDAAAGSDGGGGSPPFGFGGGSRVPSFRELRAGITQELHRDEDFVEDAFWEPGDFGSSLPQGMRVEGGGGEGDGESGDSWKAGSYPHSEEERFAGKKRASDRVRSESGIESSGTNGPLDRRKGMERDAEDSAFDVLFDAVQIVAENSPRQLPRAGAQAPVPTFGKTDKDSSDEYSLKNIRKDDSGLGERSFPGIGPWKSSNADVSSDKLIFQDMVQQGNETSGTKPKSVFPRQGFVSRRQGSAMPADDSDISFADTAGASVLPSVKSKLGTSSNEFDLSDYSFKNIARRTSEFDFLSIKQPAVQREPRQTAEDDEELSIFEPSFKVLSDTFTRQAPDMKALSSSRSPSTASGLFSILDAPDETSKSPSAESSTFFTSPPSKAVTLQTTKEYTYEELGKKLQQLRSPLGYNMGGALGFFFQEFGERLLKLRKMEEDGGGNLQAYQELRESLSHLLTPAPRPDLFVPKVGGFSLGKLALLNRMGMGGRPIPKITYLPPNDCLLEKYFSREQMSSKEVLKIEIHNLMEEYQVHEADTGSPQVQVAILTAKINNLNRHFRENHNKKRDKHSRRGLNGMVQSRKRLLWYLRRRDWDAYCNVLTKLCLPDILHEKLASKYK